jgi:transposase
MKVGLVIDRTGTPVGLLTDAANVAETDLGERVLATIPEAGVLPEQVPVIADRAYDSDPLRQRLAGAGFQLRAPHRRHRRRPATNDGRRLRRYRRRYLVERTIGWLHSFRRVMVRQEYYSYLFDGFVHLATAFLILSRL